MSESKENRVKKTRKRVPTSCSICRRRKMKCDKQKPHCGSCQIHGTTDLCVYETQPWIKPANNSDDNLQLLEQITTLQERVKQLEAQIEYSNILKSGAAPLQPPKIYHSSTSSHLSSSSNENPSSNTSPTSTESNNLPSFHYDDTIVNLAEKFDCLLIKEEKLMHFGATSYMSLVQNDPILSSLFTHYLKKHTEKVQGVVFSCGDETEFGLKLKGKPSTIEPESKQKFSDIVEDINNILPNREIVMLMIDRFFAFSYHFVPFVDERQFRDELDLILGTDAIGKSFLVVPHNSVLSTVGIFLIMLRLSFLTLPMREYANGTLKSDASESLIKLCSSGISIGPIYIEHAKRCILGAGLLRKVTIKNIQAAMFLRVYRFHSPEDGDEGTDSTVLVAMIIQMARALGLYRDPEKFSATLGGEEAKHVWRKIWHHLLYLDSSQAINFGSPLIISDHEFDTKLPYISDALQVGDSQNTEEYVIKAFELQWEVTKLLRAVTKLSGNIHKPVKRSEIQYRIGEIEHALNFQLRTFDQLIDASNSVDPHYQNIIKAQEFCHRTTLTMVYYILNYILFLTCESHEVDLNEKFSQGAAEKALTLFKIGFDFLQDTSSMFGSELETIIAPYILLATQRALQIVFSLSLRSEYGLFSLARSLNNFKSTDSNGLLNWLEIDSSDEELVVKKLSKKIEIIYSLASKLAFKYFHCWRICMLIKLFLTHSKTTHPNAYKDINIAENDDIHMQEAEFWNQLIDEAGQITFDYFTPSLSENMNLDPFLNDTPFGTTASSDLFNKFLDNDNLFHKESTIHASSSEAVFSPSEFTNSSNFFVEERSSNDVLSPETKLGLDIAKTMFG